MAIRLENWSVVSFGNGYNAPEQLTVHFKGNAYGHPNFKDDEPIVTTRITSCKDNIFKSFSGRSYVLGEVDPDFEKLYPNALERVLNSVCNFDEEDEEVIR